jgi:drug/metabolite transporter (DMT)-like permease
LRGRRGRGTFRGLFSTRAAPAAPLCRGRFLSELSATSPFGLLALGTALCNAFGGIVTAELLGRFGGSFALTRLQLLIASLSLAAVATATGGWASLYAWQLLPLFLSSLFAIVIASPAYIGSIGMLGARRASLIFSLNAPLAALLGYLVLGEQLGPAQAAGMALVVAGVALAVAFGYRAPGLHRENRVSRLGLAAGLIAALGQAIGNLAARPVMAAHADPFAVMWIRITIALVVLTAAAQFRADWRGGWQRLPPRAFAAAVLGTWVSLVVGMSLLMAALAAASVAVASTLASTAPVLVLPMLWLRTGTVPAWRAWAGALLAVAGIALLFLG